MGEYYGMSKAELIKLDKVGEYAAGSVHCPTAFDSVVLLVVNEDFVFGYYQYMQNKKQYFQRKLQSTFPRSEEGESKYYFDSPLGRYYLDMFMSQWL